MGTEIIESSFLSIFALISFFIFLFISKYSHKIKDGALLDKDFLLIIKKIKNVINVKIDKKFNSIWLLSIYLTKPLLFFLNI